MSAGDRSGQRIEGSVHGRPVAVVTGASGGIGRAIVARLLADDLDVVAVDQGPDPDARWYSVGADLTTREGNRTAIDTALERYGRLDVVVANAGVQHVAPVAEFPEDQWDRLLALLLTSPFLLAKYAWPSLTASPRARIIVVASAHGLVASPFKTGYVSAKHGVIGLVKTLALEGGEHEIMCTAVCPGWVRTPLVDAQIADQARSHGISEQRVLEDVLLTAQAVKRMIEPSEVADAVAFLASDSGRSFTGSAVTMDLGWTAR